MVDLGSGSQREIDDMMLTRYACYLTAQNGDPKEPEIAFAQTGEHVTNNQAVRETLLERGIRSEDADLGQATSRRKALWAPSMRPETVECGWDPMNVTRCELDAYGAPGFAEISEIGPTRLDFLIEKGDSSYIYPPQDTPQGLRRGSVFLGACGRA